ncbi:acyl carrier protein [Streptomyces armeniacus]|uniref:Acyl carrier protein n=1 Tax=Streptomyces armeniacus TaxID=83291 RepID=A0A345XR62_9ACTN|nr:acyl carrier protein [Streptomyces armeniacus]AXK34128.1 acyl carrier protein [Streptomyces armeniacus]
MEQQQPVFDTLAALLAEHFDLDRARLTPETTFGDLEMDSLALMEMLVVAESELGMVLSDTDNDLDSDSTLAEAAALMERLGVGGPRPAEQAAP